MREVIADITGIPTTALLGTPLSSFTVNERLRWAAKRETKRKEDKAYCLLGIFGIFLPPIYGEDDNAYRRLRQEIEKSGAFVQDLPERKNSRSCTDSNEIPTSSPTDNFTRQELARQERARKGRRRELLSRLTFDRIDARHSAIKDAQRTTCEWLLQHPEYDAWASPEERPNDQGIFWIVGKPGAGKSTLMKYALAHAKSKKASNEIVLSFFFNARGEDLEKTTLGMYRSLLFQLLSEAPDLQDVLDNPIIPTIGTAHSSPWTLDNLQCVLSNAIAKLGSRRLGFFIDALDECEEQQVRSMMEFFEELEEHAIGAESRVDICFASRHYPTIQIHYGWRLVLEDEDGHSDDLRKYIDRRLKAGEGRFVTEIQEEVLKKANGVFMWVVLVVEILNQEFRRGRVFAVRQRLQEIPTDLSNLFNDVLRRDRVNMDELQLCLQWILFARRPLGPEEFYFAMLAGLPQDRENRRLAQPWDPNEVTLADMDRFVLNSSKGLAEITTSHAVRTIQFIHESVRDFLLKDGGMCDVFPDLEGQLVTSSHDTLKKCCRAYLDADLSGFVDPTQALPHPSSNEAIELQDQVLGAFPFLRYAVDEVFYHADEAAVDRSQETFLEGFVVHKWARANNIQHRNNWRYSDDPQLLYVFAQENCPLLISALHCEDVWIRTAEESYPFPAVSAFAHGNRLTLKALMGTRGEPFIDDIVKDFGFGKVSQFHAGQDLLEWAIQNNNWSFVECLLTAYKGMGLFSVAAGTDKYSTALQVACTNGHEKIVYLLLEAGANVNTREGYFGSALQAASFGGCEGVVQMLLNAGADVNAQGGHYGNALQAASRDGNEQVVRRLLSAGANANAQGGEFGNALQAASERGREDIVRLLLAAGADVNALGGPFKSALHAACWTRRPKMVEILVSAGADVQAHGGPYGQALQAALQCGHYEVARTLMFASEFKPWSEM